MTNKERWDLLTASLPSPQSYIDFSYYWMISSCLQRRVWYYDGPHALFPNLYGCLVGDPGVGKGLPLKMVDRIMRANFYEKGAAIRTTTGLELPPLFPLGADCVTFAELMVKIAEAARSFVKADKSTYVHSSFAFILPELSSLFQRKIEDVSKFLNNAYDCDKYEYGTKHNDSYLLRKLCLSLLAATQLDFLKEAQRLGIFTQGFSSRTIFIFGVEPRFYEFHLSEYTEEHKKVERELIVWVKKLSELFGEITYTQETSNWLNNWYHTVHVPQEKAAGKVMKAYYARKKVHMLKMAAAIHFSESLEMVISLEAMQKSVDLLASVEPLMAAGLSLLGSNNLYIIGRQIASFIHVQPRTMAELLLQFGQDIALQELQLVLIELQIIGSIAQQTNGTYYGKST